MPHEVFVLGLDEHNRAELESQPDAGDYRFHPLLSIEELQYGDEIRLHDLLRDAEQQLRAAVRVDAIVGFWDFPVSSMVPILCDRLGGLHCAGLDAVLRCEHKYWSRLEQRAVIDEYPAFGLVDPERDTAPPDGVGFPMWVKPVKSFSSDLAFGVADHQEFTEALTRIREGIGRIGEPFQDVLDMVELPAEIRDAGGRVCLAEESMGGRQLTVEGYRHRGETRIYGIVDSVTEPDSPSFVRFQYPAPVPAAVADRMTRVSRLVLERVGLDESTFNIEFFWDEEADRLRVLEVNPRHSQSHAELFDQVDGAPNHRAMLRLALGLDPDMPSRRGPYAMSAKWFLRRHADGVVRRVPTAEEIAHAEREVPGSTVDVIVAEGDRLSDLVDQDSYSYKIANIYTGGDDEDDLQRRFRRCVDLLPFEVDESAARDPEAGR